jgi:hypothetical protein|nr:MAG TPA: hypothetical protein [Crassvirales sp.]
MIERLSKYIKILVLVIVGILSISTYILYQNNKSLESQLDISKSNEKAFAIENSGLKDQNRAFQFTVEQLEYFNDSLITKMNEVRKELRIKDKDLKQMQYLLSEAQKKDTIVFRDTIFRDPLVRVDTLLGDKWYQLKLGLRYPSTIITEPKFISEKYVIVDYRKETIDPPKKCFIARWFQKKHKVVEVEVVEKNPYIENKQQRFIEIVK